MKPSENIAGRWVNPIYVIMVALLVWGGYLTLGAIRAPGNHAIWRGLIVFACTLAFLALWMVALALRRRNARQS
jgi:membrane protein DedA with SNARE-associated domain